MTRATHTASRPASRPARPADATTAAATATASATARTTLALQRQTVNSEQGTVNCDGAAAVAARPSGTLGARLWHLRLARTPLHASTLARPALRQPAGQSARQPAGQPARQQPQPKVHPRLAAELVSHSILKTPSTTAPFPANPATPGAPGATDDGKGKGAK